jgi:heterodisulfide reductase subunit B
MMRAGYFPGCTLKGKAKSLDETTHIAVGLLGSKLEEIPEWTCCGATTPLTGMKIANLVAQTRLLAKTRDAGFDAVVTTCPFCFSTLRRANLTLKNDPLIRRRMNTYLAEDLRLRDYEDAPPAWVPYNGEIKVLHLLEWFRDTIGFETLGHAVKRPLTGLKVAPFYGCQLLRPADELVMCDPENPVIFEEFLSALGAEVLNFPARIDCCGSYLSAAKPDAALRASHKILYSAKKLAADTVVVTCPLCFYNLDALQPKMLKEYPDFRSIPITYFTQLLALALGVAPEKLFFESHVIDPLPVLENALSVAR